MTLYLIVTVLFFAITSILTGREIKRHPYFKPVPMSGTLNVFLFARYLKSRNEPLGVNVWLFIAAHVNLAVCAILFLMRALNA